MRLTAGGAPVALNWSTKVRNSLYIRSNKYEYETHLSTCNTPQRSLIEKNQEIILQFYSMMEILYFMDLNAGL
jgi:hypothetical protein